MTWAKDPNRTYEFDGDRLVGEHLATWDGIRDISASSTMVTETPEVEKEKDNWPMTMHPRAKAGEIQKARPSQLSATSGPGAVNRGNAIQGPRGRDRWSSGHIMKASIPSKTTPKEPSPIFFPTR